MAQHGYDAHPPIRPSRSASQTAKQSNLQVSVPPTMTYSQWRFIGARSKQSIYYYSLQIASVPVPLEALHQEAGVSRTGWADHGFRTIGCW